MRVRAESPNQLHRLITLFEQVLSQNITTTLEVDARGNASVVLFASRAGLCDIQIPFYDPALKDVPNAMCTLTIACEVTPAPCSNGLSAVMRACRDSGNETENFTTLSGLLDHK